LKVKGLALTVIWSGRSGSRFAVAADVAPAVGSAVDGSGPVQVWPVFAQVGERRVVDVVAAR
jgi:hypothetical protein